MARSLSAALVLIACSGTMLPIGPAQGQPGGGGDASRRVAATALDAIPELTGRDFAGVQLAMAPQVGGVRLAARRVTAWTEHPGPGPQAGTTIGGAVQRALLAGDVEITLGGSRFTAARAVVWIESLGSSPATRTRPAMPMFQVAVYFDRVSDPAAEAGSSAAGDRLLVTGVVLGEVSLRGDEVASGRPGDDEELFLAESEQRLARYLQELLGAGELATDSSGELMDVLPTPGRHGQRGIVIPGLSQPYEPDSIYGDPNRPRSRGTVLGGASGESGAPIFAGRGTLSVSAGDPTILTGDAARAMGGQNAVVITGGVVVQYSDARHERSLQLTCERAVIFLEDGSLETLLAAPVEKVQGVYLEGNVIATDGRYTLRGPQMYYDVKANRAMVLDAVFWTYDEARGLPLYVRAKTLRQLASNQFQGEDVRVTTSSFFQPALALGVREVTITRDVPPGQIARTILKGDDFTARAGDVPFFYWPSFDGNIERFPLRDVRFSNSSASGFGVKTRWDLFGLLGEEPGPEWNADLLVDGWINRGPAVGADVTWDTDNAKGTMFAYTVPYDMGKDVLASGAEVDRDGMFRGMFLGDHRWQLTEHWQGFLELSAISDANFVQAYYENLAQTRREFTSSAYFKRLDDNTLFSAMARGNVNTFSSNQYILESQGYDVSKLPEFAYYRVADDVLSGIAPGMLNYSSEYRLSYMSLNFTEKSPKALGMDSTSLSLDAFGMPDFNQTIGDSLDERGFDEQWAARFDTRHELSSPLDAGPVRLTPFVVGRFTAYDREYSNFAGESEDRFRGWAAAGLRAGTSINRVYDEAESRLLDIHRLRHIIEPSATLWIAGTNRQDGSLPIYDDRVEGINQGAAVRAGVSNTLQTQRGGEGRWRTVDVLKVDTNVVYAADNARRESPIGRFVDWRPELSQLGQFAEVDATWQTTDALALTAQHTYDFELNQPARTSAGLIWQQWSDTTFFTQMHYLNDRDATYVSTGADFRLTPKWTVGVTTTWDVQDSDFQSATARFRREFPQLTVGVRVGFSNITDEVSLGVELIPAGEDYRVASLRRLNRGLLESGFTEAGTGGLGESFGGGPLGGSTGR